MNTANIEAAIATLLTYDGRHILGDRIERDDEGHMIAGGVPAILADRLGLDWPDVADDYEDGRYRWVDHDLAGWLGVDIATASRIEDAYTLTDAVSRLESLIACGACDEQPADCECAAVGMAVAI